MRVLLFHGRLQFDPTQVEQRAVQLPDGLHCDAGFSACERHAAEFHALVMVVFPGGSVSVHQSGVVMGKRAGF